MAEIQQRSAILTGRLRVASPGLFARLFLAPVLGQLAQQHPLLRIELLANDELDPRAPWELDVVIWFGPLPDVQWRPFPLGRAANVLCAAPAVAASLAGAAPAELGRARTVHYSRSIQAPSWHLVRGAETLEVAIDPWLRTDDADSALAAVMSGYGVASLPGVLAEPHLRAGRLARVLPDWRVEIGPITALYRPSSRTMAAVQAFLAGVQRAALGAQSHEASLETLA